MPNDFVHKVVSNRLWFRFRSIKGVNAQVPGSPTPVPSLSTQHADFSASGPSAPTQQRCRCALEGDELFRDLVLARIIKPTSQVDSLWMPCGTGVESLAYRTLKRQLQVFAKPAVRQALSNACAAHARLGPGSLVLYAVSTFHFETDAGDGFRESGFCKEHRLEP